MIEDKVEEKQFKEGLQKQVQEPQDVQESNRILIENLDFSSDKQFSEELIISENSLSSKNNDSHSDEEFRSFKKKQCFKEIQENVQQKKIDFQDLDLKIEQVQVQEKQSEQQYQEIQILEQNPNQGKNQKEKLVYLEQKESGSGGEQNLTIFQLENRRQNIVFHTIIDVQNELSKSNFIPILVALSEGYGKVQDLDQFGYSLLHHCVAQSNFDLAVYLVSNLGCPIDIRSGTGMTALMMACNYSNYELTKLCLFWGAKLDLQDNYKFSALLYSVKSNSMPLFFYFISLGADYNQTDYNQSGIQHWAAYNNNVQILQFCSQIGIDLFSKDLQGFTPLERAVQNFAYQAIEFLAYKNPEIIKQFSVKKQLPNHTEQENLQLEKEKDKKIIYISSKSINKILEDSLQNLPEYQAKKIKIVNQKILTKISQNQNKIFFCSILITATLLIATHFSSQNKQNSETPFFSLFLVVLYLQYLFVLFFFIFNVPSATENFSKQLLVNTDNSCLLQNENENKIIQLEQNLLQNGYNKIPQFPAIEAILNKINHFSFGNTNHSKNTFLYEICLLWECNNFKEIKSYDFDRVCMICMKYKNQKTEHCTKCDTCVENWSHHSSLFNKCISAKNHLVYMAVITIQQILLLSYVLSQIYFYLDKITSWRLFIIVETPFLIAQNEGLANSLGIMVAYICLFYNSINFIIEFYGIIHDRTRNEIFNPHKYRYLFQTFSDDKGRILLKRIGPFKNGLLQNVKNYFIRSQKFLRIKE